MLIGEARGDRGRAFRGLRDLQPYMTIVFAGPIAEAALTDGPFEPPTPGIIAAAKADLGDVLSEHEIEVIVGGAAKLAERLVSHPKTSDALLALRSALLTSRTLTQAEVDDVVAVRLPEYAALFEDDEKWELTIRGPRRR